MPNRACEVTEQPANEPEPEGRQEWAESNEVTSDEDVYASLQKNSQVDDCACKDEEKSEPQDEVEETTSLVEVAPKPEPNSRLGSFFSGSWRLWSLPWDLRLKARIDIPMWGTKMASSLHHFFESFLLITWLLSLSASLTCCLKLGSLHMYGDHSQLQIAAAIACSLILATWAVAEACNQLGPHAGDMQGYELASTADVDPVIVGRKVADDAGPDPEVCQNVDDSAEKEEAKEGMRRTSVAVQAWLKEHVSAWRAGAELCAILAFLYLCDRTAVLPEGPKIRDPKFFWGLWAVIVIVACFTIRKTEESNPLSREQTDEWKGWMQIMFLMYHYFEEKEVYNAIRVYIAAYVWMTGYGNFFLYRKGKSFTARRTAQMLFRLNFLGLVVCVVLRNEYMLYYICAMHTLFTVFVLVAMFAFHTMNSLYSVLWVKILATFAVTVVLYDGPDIIFRLVFGTLPVVRPLFAFHDPLHPEFKDEMHEFHFRSGLDRYIWIFGMICALHYNHFAALLQLNVSSCARRLAIQVTLVLVALACGALWWKHVFQLDKYAYNKIHPFTSFVPLTAYLILRNCTEGLRKRYLYLFAYMGRTTLETYIFQFHIWMRTTGLNGSPKKLLVVIPGSYWLNFAVLTAIYIFVSIRFSHLTGVLRDALIPSSLRATLWISDKHFSSRPSTSAEHSSEGELLVSDEDIDSRLNDQQAPDIVGLESWQVVDSGGLVVAEDDAVDAIQVGRGSVEAKMERMLTWMLAPAVHGIPKLGVLPAEERAAELLAQHDRDVEAAVREVVAGSERSVSTVVLNFCLERIPVLGCPTVLLKTTWGNLRSILIIAAMYGHDLESARVQHEALLCLVPPGDDKDSCAAALKQQNASPDLNPAVFVSTTAQQVAHFMIRGALRRATGLQAAVDCFELASLLYSSCGTDALDEDGFVHLTATPASAARDFFRKKSFASCAILWCSLPFLVLGMAAPNLFAMARLVPIMLGCLRAVVGRICLESQQDAIAAPAFGSTFKTLTCLQKQRSRPCVWSI
eukprot:s890_g5.t1